MYKKLLLAGLWFPMVILLLINNFILLNKTTAEKHKLSIHELSASVLADNTMNINKSGTGKVLSLSIEGADGRVVLLENFMKKTPLAQYAQHIVSEADRLNIDYRIIPAIAMCESNLGKRIPSSDSYNAWGIAVYTGTNSGATFKNWNEAITWVSEYIHTKYIQKNLIDIKDIGAIYAPPSVETGHSWANCVENFMRSIE
jgi:hypothetical protein